MIWIAREGAAEETGVARHVREIIAAHGGEEPLPDTWVDEVSKAVSAFVAEGDGAGLYVDSEHLVLLASQAISSVGAPAAARRLLVFGSGLVAPSSWEIRGGGAVWTLDFGRMAVRAGTSLELVFFRSLQLVIESMADVWDSTHGQGTLGLRHARTAAHDVLGKKDRRAVQRFTEEVCAVCRAKLRQLAGKRHWVSVPDLLQLDGI